MEVQCPFVGPLSETDFIASMTINEFKKNTNVLQILIKELLTRIPKQFEKEIARADFYIEQAFSQYVSNIPSRFTKFKRIRYISKSPTNLETDKGFLNPNPSMLGTSVKRKAIKSALKRCFKFQPNSISFDDFLEYSNIVLLLRNKFNDRYQTGVYTFNAEMVTKRIYDEFLIRRNTFPPDLKFKAEYIYWSVIPQRYQMYFDKNMRPKTESENTCDTENLETSETLNINNINKPIDESFDPQLDENIASKSKQNSLDAITEDKVTTIVVFENIASENHATKRNATEIDLSFISKKLRLSSKSTSNADNTNGEQLPIQLENNVEMSDSTSHSSVEMVNESTDDLSNISYNVEMSESASHNYEEMVNESTDDLSNASYDDDVQIVEYVEEPIYDQPSPIIYEITELRDELLRSSPLDQTLIRDPEPPHDLSEFEVNESVIEDEYQNNDSVSVVIEKELVIKQEPIYSQINIINVPWATTDVIEIEINDDSDEVSNKNAQNKNHLPLNMEPKNHKQSFNNLSRYINSQNLYSALLNHDCTFFNFTELNEVAVSSDDEIPKSIHPHANQSSNYPLSAINILDLSSFRLQLKSCGQPEFQITIGMENSHSRILTVCSSQVYSLFKFTDIQWADIYNIIKFIKVFNYNGSPPNVETSLPYKILYYLFKTHPRISASAATLVCSKFSCGTTVVKHNRKCKTSTALPISPNILKAMEIKKNN